MGKKSRYLLAGVLLLVVILYTLSIPSTLFSVPYSTVLQAKKGELLTATIAADGQWRFPLADTLPDKFVQAIVAYEDKRFFEHVGVDILAMARSLRQNIKAKKIVSGGSTLTMQVVRLSRQNKPRTIVEKMIEMVLATRVEWRYTKDEILRLYAAHAPFGGNVVGLDAACWRYFGRGMHDLSWGEAALLAVLPNAPSLMHPGKNRNELLGKRNALLDKLAKLSIIDSLVCQLAKEEFIPEKPLPIPRHARHLTQRVKSELKQGAIVHTSIDFTLQQDVEYLVHQHQKQLQAKQIHNTAVLVLHVPTGEVLAYVGNAEEDRGGDHHREVDIINSPRSTGSILKPFLYAAALEAGKILPYSLLPDVPTFINGFSPKNFSKEYDGAVAADKALIRSLNVPAVHLLKDFRYEKFHTLLKDLGMTTLEQGPDHYGLSLILGGAEGKLWDITGMYASMARVVNNFFTRPGSNKYSSNDWHPPVYDLAKPKEKDIMPIVSSRISAAALYQTLEVLTDVYRPSEESGWRYFSSSKKIAWKTGTSYGFRDGWAVGLTPEFAVGVWVGNADGEGRPGLTGTESAAPLLFSIFSRLPSTTWFSKPIVEMEPVIVCSKSGFRASVLCEELDTIARVKSALTTISCPFHQRVHLSGDATYRVNSQCYSVADMLTKTWFVLPPVQEYYFKEKVISYVSLPPLMGGCIEQKTVMEMLYPKQHARIFIPRNLAGVIGQVLFQVTHNQVSAKIFWHLDDRYIGSTQGLHQLALQPEKGKHVLTLVDDLGNALVQHFEVINSM